MAKGDMLPKDQSRFSNPGQSDLPTIGSRINPNNAGGEFVPKSSGPGSLPYGINRQQYHLPVDHPDATVGDD